MCTTGAVTRLRIRRSPSRSLARHECHGRAAGSGNIERRRTRLLGLFFCLSDVVPRTGSLIRLWGARGRSVLISTLHWTSSVSSWPAVAVPRVQRGIGKQEQSATIKGPLEAPPIATESAGACPYLYVAADYGSPGGSGLRVAFLFRPWCQVPGAPRTSSR